jgi:ribonuclease R
MGKSQEKKSRRMTKRMLTAAMADMFEAYKDDNITLNKVFQELRLKTHPLKMLAGDIIREMLEDGYIVETRKGNYRLAAPAASTIEKEKEEKAREEETLIGRTFVGTLKVSKNYAFLLTHSRELTDDIFIPRDKLKNGKSGEKAVVKIVDMPRNSKNPIGIVVDILGKSGENNTEMHAILAEFGLPYVYPKAVEEAANRISDVITDAEMARRKDFRDVLTFTIDPYDAKDFDDALSIRSFGKGEWEIGVHIADVTHYVNEGGIIDKEAQRRATSVYLVDRTVPMLPERLSNYICSLRPDEEKLCYAVIIHMDEQGHVRHHKIVHTVIRSNRRYTYEEVQAIIDREIKKRELPYGTFREQTAVELPGDEYANELMTLHRLAQLLRKERFANGSIAFDRVEVGFDIDETGHPVSVHLKEQTESHQLIEEFMLLANRIVATTIGQVPTKRQKVFPYRIHDLPDSEKLDNVARFILRFGYKLKTTGTKEEMSNSINRLLADVKGKREQNLIETISLKAMQKARYSTDNIGHYGLAFDYYTHFTSPIRRFPDMMVHRLLNRYLAGGRSVSKVKYEELCDHSSAMEQLAAQAERASIKYKQVEFMQDRMGQVFDALISGVTEWGLYAEIVENKCEGLIPVRDLEDDYYEFDEKNYCLIGRRTRKRYLLGDKVKVQVARCDLEKKQLDFTLVE